MGWLVSLIFILFEKFPGSKYDRVDEDNKYGATNQRRRDSRDTTADNDNKAWFVEL